MNATITATVNAAKSAQAALVGAIHDAADGLSRVGRDPVKDALARLAREAQGARERLEEGRREALSILEGAFGGFACFAAEVEAPAEQPLPSPAFVALDYAPEPEHDAEDGIVDAAPTPEVPGVGVPRGEDAAEVDAPASPPAPAPEYPAEECEGCFDFSADVLPRANGSRLCPTCERSRLDAEREEARQLGLAVIAAQGVAGVSQDPDEDKYIMESMRQLHPEEVLATAANDGAAPATPPAPKKARGRRKTK